MIHILTITNHSGQTEPISKFENFEMVEELNGSFTLSFTSFPHINNPGHSLIDQETIIEYEGYSFRVKQLRNHTFSKQVTAISTYFDNSDNRKYDKLEGTHTFDEFMTYLLEDTGWTFINEDLTLSMSISDFGDNYITQLIDVLRAAFKCEMKIEPNNVLRFSTKVGPDNDEQYRYGHNIISINESIDTTGLKTYIEGFGAEGLHIKYTSPAADHPGIGIRHAEPIRDDTISDPDELLKRLKDDLQDYPESTIELDAIELREKEIGERVWLIHEKMGLEYQTRVMTKRTKIPKTLSTVTLGNIKPKTLSDMLGQHKVDIDNVGKQTRSRIDKTDERITLEVERIDESISQIELTADQIILSVEDLDDDLRSEISITTTQIRSEVAGNVERLDGLVENASSNITQTANQIRSEIQSEVTRLDDKVDTANSSIEQTASSIRSEVNTEVIRVDGRIDASNSLITQFSNQITFDISEVKGDVGILYSQVDIQSGQISSKVEKIDYNGGVIKSLINQDAYGVTIDAKNINLSGITNVAQTLTLGSGSGSVANIKFNGTDSWISANGGGLAFDSVGYFVFNNVVDFQNHTPRNLNLTARFG